jgi:hypothetical protein
MADISRTKLTDAFAATSLFEAKSWQLSPEAWPLTRAEIVELKKIGEACLLFHQALETLYLRSVAGKSLLRNRSLVTPWVVDYLDRGKPAALVAHARDSRQKGAIPHVLRPDLLLTDEGFAMSELDSVPGGIGLTAFLNRLYAAEGEILGGGDEMMTVFYRSLAELAPGSKNPVIALVVSDEAATYRPEMMWLAAQLQLKGYRVYCLAPEDIFPLGQTLCLDADGNPEKIEVIYRFFELFDLANISTASYIFEAWDAGEVAITPPMRPFQEEKLSLALFHHHLLVDFWKETLSSQVWKLLKKLIPQSWVIDPSPLPPGAILDGPMAGGRPLASWLGLNGASKKERELILKISGFHESAWGARSVVYGADCSREEWQAGLDIALNDAPTNLHLLQEYRKPRRLTHRLYPAEGGKGAEVGAVARQGRLRLCPYYFVVDNTPQLAGALATFCPPDKKIIHGMQDAALLPCRVID